MDTLRASGKVSGGSPPLTLADQNAFASHLDTWLPPAVQTLRSTAWFATSVTAMPVRSAPLRPC